MIWNRHTSQMLIATLALTMIVGCGSSRYPVMGRVTYEDGGPVEAGTVIAEGRINDEVVSVQGNIEPDGSFELGADLPGDGALPGSYRALVMPVALGDAELAEGKRPAVDGKYTSYESSGFTFEVKPADNVLNFQVTRPLTK